MSSLVRLENISKYFPLRDRAVLHDLNLSVDQCESLAIMGASGSGKSTLLRILGLLDEPTTGQYFLQDEDVAILSSNEKALARNRLFGFIFQSNILIPHLSLLENCALPLYYRKQHQEEARIVAADWLDKLGLKGLERRYPHQVSGGQQQRAAIARAIVGYPRILLADEPTSALDHHTKKDVLNLLLSLQKQHQLSLVIVTHDEVVAQSCDRIFCLEELS